MNMEKIDPFFQKMRISWPKTDPIFQNRGHADFEKYIYPLTTGVAGPGGGGGGVVPPNFIKVGKNVARNPVSAPVDIMIARP